VRVVVVSAHFPPNHVSGGTLVPQRIARDLARRGHEVAVYAGYLDESREPLSTWEETDRDGVRIRWIVTTPWTAWNDPLNSDNPGVAEDFAAWLDRERPDVVHLHSLQTLGGGLVPVAKSSGAAVVVTMHDFWWVCARQFLVDRDVRPCSLVVDCGSCACAVDRHWLAARDDRLRQQLESADLILAPSRSTARVLIANGIDERRVRVDENGLVGPVATRPAREVVPADMPVRFLFTGGPDPMKGLPVLLEAVRALPRDGSWTLDLYGVDELHGSRPAGVTLKPPYAPDEVDHVLAEHDVLVLPSVARETHSLVTREALAAGLAVVCTDAPGPEEAVEHGVNGFVVRAGDPGSLSTAMGRLAADRDLVSQMQSVGLQTPVRSFDDQVDGLEQMFQELVSHRPDVTSAGAPVTVDATADAPDVRHAQRSLLGRVLFVVGIQGAPLRYRAHLPAEALRLRGIHVDVLHYRDPELRSLAALADGLVLYRVPATDQVLDLVAEVRDRDRPVPVIFDIDDLIFDPDLSGVHGLEALSEEDRRLWWRGVARYRTTMEVCDAFVGSTDALCAHVTEVAGLPSYRFANGVGQRLARLSERELARDRSAGPPRIGYFSGTDTHDADWAVIEPAVIEVLRSRPDVELWVGGLLRTGPELASFGQRIRRLPMVPWTDLPARLRDLDVNLAPLVLGSEFNEAKSAIKWLEAALVETPTVASPTQPFVEAIDHGRSGFVARTHDEWVERITVLLDDELLRRRMGGVARREALLRWSPARQGERYEEILRLVAEHRRAEGPRQPSSWVAVTESEPPSAVDGWVEVYGKADESDIATATPGRARRAAAAVVRVHRAAGVRGVAVKTLSVARRHLRSRLR
jgi:glycosyltransferase involved in cell wall biosynthesis